MSPATSFHRSSPAPRYACVLRPPPPDCPEPVLSIARSLEACFASSTSSSNSRYHVLCTHQDQVMQLSEGTFLLAGNDACKHGMVRWCLLLINFSNVFLCICPALHLSIFYTACTPCKTSRSSSSHTLQTPSPFRVTAVCRSPQPCESSHEKRLRLCAGHPEFSLEFLRAMGTLRQQMYARAASSALVHVNHGLQTATERRLSLLV